MATTRLTIVALIVLIILLISAGVYTITKNDDEQEVITAMEGKLIADEVALNWSENATLIHVHRGSNEGGNGRYLAWFYTYIESPLMPLTGNESNCVAIIVYANGSSELGRGAIGEEIPLHNWTLNSDKAYQIAKSNDNMKTFLAHDPSVYVFSLHSSPTPYWFIEWTYDAGFDDPKWAQIQIDANTGEVLYVHADD